MIMDKISAGEGVGGAGGAYSYSALKRLDQIWSSICEAQAGTPQMAKHYIYICLSGFAASDLVFLGEKAVGKPLQHTFIFFKKKNYRRSQRKQERSYREFSQNNSLALKEGLNLSICNFNISLKQHRQKVKGASFLKMKSFICFQMHYTTRARISMKKLWPKTPLVS
jgi:hypothetical protein